MKEPDFRVIVPYTLSLLLALCPFSIGRNLPTPKDDTTEPTLNLVVELLVELLGDVVADFLHDLFLVDLLVDDFFWFVSSLVDDESEDFLFDKHSPVIGVTFVYPPALVLLSHCV